MEAITGRQVMTASVSVIELYRRWESGMTKWVGVKGEKEEEEVTWEEFLEMLTAPQTPQMAMGEAFHSALEVIDREAELHDYLEDPKSGTVFDFTNFDGELALGQFQEFKAAKMYGPLLVRGRVDDVNGLTVTDYKFTLSSFDADRYFDSFQWRFYLDMLGGNTFVYQVFEGYLAGFKAEDGSGYDSNSSEIEVKKLHTLKFYRYPELEADCQSLAERFHAVALCHPQIAKLRDESEL